MHTAAGAPHPAIPQLAQHWAGQAAWTVLDTAFGGGHTFLDLWQRWSDHAHAPRVLHYVAVLPAEHAAQLPTALRAAHPQPALAAPHAETLAALSYGLDAGFHRILLAGGHVSLTLCVGDLGTVLAQQNMLADSILADAAAAHWDKWLLKALARHGRRGCHLHGDGATLPAQSMLDAAGWVRPACGTGPQTSAPAHAVFDPRWALRNTRRTGPSASVAPGRCAVIGAGIAGASVARALALRGWMVDVLDSAASPAAGASGLPAGLVVPHHSADDSPRSRMSRAGTRLVLQHAKALLQTGVDFGPGGVLERSIQATTLDAVEAEVLSHGPDATSAVGWARAMDYAGAAGLWHPHAAWIKPRQLVAQWLAHPRILFQGHAQVHMLQRCGAQWKLCAADGRALALADTVVFANAHGCAALLQRLALATEHDLAWVPDVLDKLGLLQALHGTTSLGPCPAQPPSPWPAFPVNGHGSFVSNVPSADGPTWFAGSTFHPHAPRTSLAEEHATNLRKLHALLPLVAQDLAPLFGSGQVQAWQGTRCVTHDRLPLVGPLDDAKHPTLWLTAGMGARGLSFSALCAELLAAEMGGEPLPVESKLAKGLSTRRPRRQRAA